MAAGVNQYQLDLGDSKPAPAVLVRPMPVSPAPKPTPRRPAPEKFIDWFQVIAMLRKAGYSVQSISDAIKVPRTTLIGWKQGAEPRYSEGERLIAFWCEITSQAREKLPTCEAGDWRAYHAK